MTLKPILRYLGSALHIAFIALLGTVLTYGAPIPGKLISFGLPTSYWVVLFIIFLLALLLLIPSYKPLDDHRSRH